MNHLNSLTTVCWFIYTVQRIKKLVFHLRILSYFVIPFVVSSLFVFFAFSQLSQRRLRTELKMDVIIKFCFTRNVTGFQSSLIILLNQVKIKNSINVTTLICILSIENLSRTTQHSCLHAFDLHRFSIDYVVCNLKTYSVLSS